jgi:hemolysin III
MIVVERLERELSRWEIGADGIVHALAILAGIVGAVVLLLVAADRIGAFGIVAVSIYSTGLLAMLICSAAYNLGRQSRYGNWLRILDQAAIFVMIAGTYTPFTLLHMDGAWRASLTILVWSIALAGILTRLLTQRLFDRLAVVFYLTLGWMSVITVAPLMSGVNAPMIVVVLLAAGGLLYTIGVVFHLWRRLPYNNVIWHGFVAAAAAAHFAAVLVSMVAPPAV